MAAVALVIVATLGVKVIPPVLSRFRQPAVEPQPQPSGERGGSAKETRRAASRDGAGAGAADSGSGAAAGGAASRRENAELKKTVDDARQRAERERARAVRAKATALPRFRAGDEAMARGSDLATKNSSRIRPAPYSNAVALFLRSLDDVESALANRDPVGTRGNTAPVTPPANTGRSSAPPSAPSTRPHPQEKPAEPAPRRIPRRPSIRFRRRRVEERAAAGQADSGPADD